MREATLGIKYGTQRGARGEYNRRREWKEGQIRKKEFHMSIKGVSLTGCGVACCCWWGTYDCSTVGAMGTKL